MRFLYLIAVGMSMALVSTGCGLFDSDDGGDVYEGTVAVAMTDNVPATGNFVRQNIFNPAVREIIALVQIQDAKQGMDVSGRWYQMGVFGQQLENNTPQGALVTEAGFKLTSESITEAGGIGRLTFRPNERLPEDAYELRIYIDGKLAKTMPFVVSVLAQAPAGTGGGTPPQSPVPSATPVRTATPTR